MNTGRGAKGAVDATPDALVFLGPCVLRLCHDGSGRETVGSPVLRPRPGPVPWGSAPFTASNTGGTLNPD